MSEKVNEAEVLPERAKVKFRDDVYVQLIDSMGTEDRVVQVAKVSTLGPDARDAEGNTRLLKLLYKDQHGVPFEHVVFTFYLEMPIFVSREVVKHRISSINEVSGRYTELLPHFYVPNEERKLVQVGRTMDYQFEDGDPMQYEALKFVLKGSGQSYWDNYCTLREMGLAREVSRMHMPVNTYTQMFFTVNMRSLMNFITKRKEWPDGQVVSHALHEVEKITDQMVEIVKEKFPNVWDAYVESGYRQV